VAAPVWEMPVTLLAEAAVLEFMVWAETVDVKPAAQITDASRAKPLQDSVLRLIDSLFIKYPGALCRY
jgi:hypothetical protein